MKGFFTACNRFRFEFYESVRIALDQVRHHKMRAALTALGVMIGVLAVTLMGTAVNGIDKGFNDSLAMLGKDVFYVGRWPWGQIAHGEWRVYAARPHFRSEYAQRANEIISETPNSALDMAVIRNERYRTVRFGSNSIEGTAIVGTTSAFMQVSSMELTEGRFFSEVESDGGTRVIVLGYDVANALFPKASPLGQSVIIGNQPFRVIGVFARQGDFLGLFSMDSMAAVPDKAIPSARWDHRDPILVFKLRNGATKEAARTEIEGIMRRIRSLQPEDYDDFEINSTDIIEKDLGPVKAGVTVAGLAITSLSLFVGAIGIMNIMFVSIRERTREIGTRRALGAPRKAILVQFLVEAVVICLLGGFAGLGLSYLIAQGVKHAFPAFPVVFSPGLFAVAVSVSIFTGLVSGIIPAWMASRMDPAEALRHD